MTITLDGINAARRANAVRYLCLAVVSAIVLALAIAGITHDNNTAVSTADVGAVTAIASVGGTTVITTARGRIGVNGPVAYKTGQALELRQFPSGNTYLCMQASCVAALNVMWPMTPTGATTFPLALLALLAVLSTFTLICLLVMSYAESR